MDQRMQETYRAAFAPGWATFAGIMCLTIGVLEAVYGIAAVSKANYVADITLFGPIELWGVVLLVVAGLALLASFALLNKQLRGRELGIGAAVLSVVAEFLFVAGNPWWALFVIAMSLSAVYALVIHGEAPRA